MAEGLLAPGGKIAGGIHDDPDSPPAPDASAVRGWTWNRKGRNWMPRQRGPVLFQDLPRPGRDSSPDGSDGLRQGSDSPAAAGTGPGPDRDPEPGWMRDDSDSKPKAPSFDPSKVSREVRDDISGMCGLVGMALLPPLVRADPVCGGAFAENFDRLVEKAVPLICRSERVVRWMTADMGGLGDWIGLGVALAPVAGAFMQHHVLKTVEVAEVENEQTGQTVRVIRPVDMTQYSTAAAA